MLWVWLILFLFLLWCYFVRYHKAFLEGNEKHKKERVGGDLRGKGGAWLLPPLGSLASEARAGASLL